MEGPHRLLKTSSALSPWTRSWVNRLSTSARVLFSLGSLVWQLADPIGSGSQHRHYWGEVGVDR